MTRKEEQEEKEQEEEEEEEGGLNYFPRLFLARSKRCLLIVGEERRRIVGSPLLYYLTYDRGVRCCSNQESLFYRRGEKEEGTWEIRMPRTVQ